MRKVCVFGRGKIDLCMRTYTHAAASTGKKQDISSTGSSSTHDFPPLTIVWRRNAGFVLAPRGVANGNRCRLGAAFGNEKGVVRTWGHGILLLVCGLCRHSVWVLESKTDSHPLPPPFAQFKRTKNWQPLLESDGLGYISTQEHVTPHIGVTARFFGFNTAEEEEAWGSRVLDPPPYRNR